MAHNKPRRRMSIDVLGTFDKTAMLTHGHSNTPDDVRSSTASSHSLPLKDVPGRTSSLATFQQASLQDFPSWKIPPFAAAGFRIPDRGRAESPIKRSIARDAVSSDNARTVPCKTFIRSTPPIKLLENGNIHHRRIRISTNLKAPLFVGGGTVEGEVRLSIDEIDNKRDHSRPLLISKLSVDVVGLEEISDGRK